MSQIDIIARLQLRAEQFSSEAGRAAADISGKMGRAAGEIRQPFLSAFADINAMAQRSIQMPRTATGSLDLSARIASLHAEADAADRAATAFAEFQRASSAAAGSAGVDSQALLQDADAAMVARNAELQLAASKRERANQLSLTQAELIKSTSATTLDSVVLNENAHAAGRASIAKMEMMHVVRASSDAFAAGAPPMQIFAMEMGRIAQAASFAGAEGDGKLAMLGKFLGGPWGIALTVGAAVAGPFIGKLMETSDASKEVHDSLEKAAASADSFGAAESLLGKVIDIQTGKLKTHNEVLIQTIKLQARANILAAQEDQKTTTKALSGIGDATFGEGAGVSVASIGSTTAGSANFTGGAAAADALSKNLAPLRSVLQDYIAIANDPRARPEAVSGALDAAISKVDGLAKSGRLAGRDLINTEKALTALGTSLNSQTANQQVLDALNGKGIAADLKPYERAKKTRTKKPKSTDALDDFGTSTKNTIAQIRGEFDDVPPTIDKASNAIGKLDLLMQKLRERKPPGFAAMIESAQQAEAVVRASINRPFDEYVKAQRESLSVQRLVAQGRDADAEALQATLRLQQAMQPLDEA